MAEYKIYFRVSVEKDFRIIPKKDLQKNLSRIEALAKDPKPPGHNRIINSVQDKERALWVVKVGQRKDVYR